MGIIILKNDNFIEKTRYPHRDSDVIYRFFTVFSAPVTHYSGTVTANNLNCGRI